MCYYIEIEIVSQNTNASTEKRIGIKEREGELYINGVFPKYKITNGHCACGFVGKNNTSVSTIDSYLGSLASHENIKRVKVIWFWGNEKPNNVIEQKMTLEEFNSLNKSNSLKENIWYSVNDPSKYIN